MDVWINLISDKIMESVKPYQITIFIDNNKASDIPQYSILLHKLQNQSNVILDYAHLIKYGNSRLIRLPGFSDLRQSTMYLAIHSQLNDKQNLLETVKQYIDHLVQIAPRAMRPKFLIVLFNKYLSSCDTLRPIFTYSWSQKFLDFTIIQLKLSHGYIAESYMFHYNPFYNVCSQEILLRKNSIFPDKLIDLNWITLKVPAYINPPLHNYEEYNGTIKLSGLYNPIIDTLSERFKFSLSYLPDRKRNITTVEAKEKLKILFSHGKVNMLPDPFRLQFVDDTLQLPISFACQKYVAVVPIMRIKKVQLPLNVFLFAFLIIMGVICITYIAYVFKIIIKKWKILYVLQLLLGKPVKTVELRRSSDRIWFCMIFLASIILCNTILLKLLDIKVIDDEIRFESFKEIDESPFEKYIDKGFLHTLNEIDQHVKNIKSNITTVDDISICIHKLLQERNCICIMSKWIAKLVISKYKDSNRNPVMKISKPSFYCARMAYIFEKGSPYIEKFGKLIQMIDESRIWVQWDQVKKFEMSLDFNETKVIVENTFVMCLYAFLCVGYVLSTIIFCTELLVKRYYI